MRKVKLVTVWLGSMSGPQPFIDSAKRFARMLTAEGAAIMYGGGSVGDMGTLAQEAKAHGGHVIGVIPHGLTEREKPVNYGQLIFVDTLAERLRIMLEGSAEHGIPCPDAIVVKPGGDGSLNELMWAILTDKLQAKHGVRCASAPIILENLDCYWDGFIMQRDTCVRHGYVDADFAKRLIVVDQTELILPAIRKALDISETNGNGNKTVVPMPAKAAG